MGEPVAIKPLPRAMGVGRDVDNDKAIFVHFTRTLTDDELRDLHELLAGRASAPSAAAATSPLGGLSQIIAEYDHIVDGRLDPRDAEADFVMRGSDWREIRKALREPSARSSGERTSPLNACQFKGFCEAESKRLQELEPSAAPAAPVIPLVGVPTEEQMQEWAKEIWTRLLFSEFAPTPISFAAAVRQAVCRYAEWCAWRTSSAIGQLPRGMKVHES